MPQLATTTLTRDERSEREHLESIIESAQMYGLREAQSLRTIRDKRLYRSSHPTFAAYCDERWGISRAQGNRLCSWAEVVSNLSPNGDTTYPTREAHARPFYTLTQQQQKKAWRQYLSTRSGRDTEREIQIACEAVAGTAIGSSVSKSLASTSPPTATMSSPITAYGGKSRLAEQIVSLLPPHTVYVEPFFGSGAVFFRKPPSEVETINDIDSNVVNFFRVLRDARQAKQLQASLRLTPYSREEHEWCRKNRDAKDPVEQARRFFVLIRQSYAGIYGDSWSQTLCKNKARDFANAVDALHLVAERLRHVQIENCDFRHILRRYDRHGVAMFLDPPYPLRVRNDRNAYRHEMSVEDHEEFLDMVASLQQAKVVICGYDDEMYRTRLRRWRRYERQVQINASPYSDRSESRPKRVEMIWCNF